MISMNLVGAIQESLNKNYDWGYAVEVTSIVKQPTFDKGGPQIQGEFILQFTCHARQLGQKSFKRLAYATWDGTSLEIPNTIIVGDYL